MSSIFEQPQLLKSLTFEAADNQRGRSPAAGKKAVVKTVRARVDIRPPEKTVRVGAESKASLESVQVGAESKKSIKTVSARAGSQPSVKSVQVGAGSKASLESVQKRADSQPSVKSVRARVHSKSLKTLGARADDVFQTAIRWRDDFACITCGARFEKGEKTRLHAGHYISRRCLATRWDEENVNAQCRGCNLKQSLADVEIIHRYETALKAKYGEDVLERLFQKKRQKLKVTRAFLEELILTYTNFINRKKREG